MRTVTETEAQQSAAATDAKPNPSHGLQTFTATLRNGKTITIREMTGRDLVYMEEELKDMGETRRSFHLIERLNVGDSSISYDEIESLGVRDIRAISELVAKANGDDEEDPK